MVAGLPSRRLLAVARKIALAGALSLLLSLLGIVVVFGGNALAQSLPGGASSIQETYQDWQVRCVSGEENASCVLTQRQVSQDTGQLLLALEFRTTEANGLAGTIAMPFGLRLGAGVTMQIDEGEPAGPLGFSTCLPGGCFVPLTTDEGVTSLLREGETLTLTAQLLDGRSILFNVSLNGFAAALDRIQAIEATM